ncbi:MAG: MG2 domain-containing protein [Lentisphaeria bacterium]|nr:MG2 domain-containing protein [Lentisphaeria bacterium]
MSALNIKSVIFLCSLLANVVLAWFLLAPKLPDWRRPGVDQVKIIESPDFNGMEVRFKTPMPRTVDELPVKLIPDIPAAHKWINDTTVRIAFLTAVPPGKNVTVLPSPGRDDADGHRLPAQPVEVSTPPLAVTRLYPVSRDDQSGLYFTMAFNGIVNPVALAEKITLKDLNDVDVPFVIESASPSSQHMVCLADTEPDRGGKRFLTVNPGLIASGGEHPMPSAYTGELVLPEKLTVSMVKGQVDGDDIVIDFSLSSQASVDALKKYISISPSTRFDVSKRWGNQYRMMGKFSPNSFYRITFEKGLHANHGETLRSDETRTVVTPPLPSSIHFLTSGPVMPISGEKVLPVKVCNMRTLAINGWKIYPNNLQAFFKDGERNPADYGIPVKGFEKDLNLAADQFHRVSVPVDGIVGDTTPGVYVFETGVDDYWWRKSSRTVVTTDIALTTHYSQEGLVVWARSFATNQPLVGYLAQVISVRNQELGRGLTDSSGKVSIALDRGVNDSETPYMIIASGHGDLSIMKLRESQHSLAAFDVSGNHHPALPYEAFMYTDRGIYRPGESVLVSTLLRDEKLAAASLVPALIKLIGPTGTVLRSETVTVDQQGFHSLSVELPPQARTGAYTIQMTMPGESRTWGQTSFKVGAFMPDRIKVELTLDKPRIKAGDELSASTRSLYYFGAPAADCDGTIRVFVRDQPYTSSRFPDFSFGDFRREVISETIVNRRFKTHENGEATSIVQVPAGLRPKARLQLMVVSAIQEPGGRAVSATQAIPVDACPFYIGLKKGATVDSAITAEWVIDPCFSEDKAPDRVTFTLFSISWERLLVKDSQNYHYAWREKSIEVKQGDVETRGALSGTLNLGPLDEGRYELLVEAPGSQAATRLNFWHATGGHDVRPSNLTHLPLNITQMTVDPGAEFRVTYSAPAKGAVMVTGGVNALDLSFSEACEKGENTLHIRMPETALGSFYLGVTFVADNPEERLVPRRLFGLVKITVNQTSRRLAPTLSCPLTVEPGATVPIDISLSRNGVPSAGYARIIAVDEGILSLTTFKTPDPFAFFFGDRSCSLSFADLYDQVFPDLSEAGTVSQDGGGGITRGQLLSPVAIDHLASAMVALPPVKVPASGSVQALLTLPDFTGGMRIMAVAFNHDAVGSTETMVTVRERATVMISAPRAVAPGDQFEVTVQALNHDVNADTAEFAFFVNGREVRQSVPTSFPLAKGVEHRLSVPITVPPDTAGAMTLEARLTLGDVSDSTQAKVTSRPVTTPSFEGQFFVIEPGAEKHVDFGAQWFPGTFTSTVEISTTPCLEIAPALAWLRAYPYGCLEQTTSAAFPMPYRAALLSPYGAAADTEKQALLGELNRAVRRIMSMEVQNGGFASWPGNDQCWVSGSVYACHFLAEARDFGADVDDFLWRRTLSFLREGVTGKITMSITDRAYALCLLSRAGKPEVGVAAGIADDQTTPPFARFLAALSLLGTSQNKEGVERMNQLMTASGYLDGELKWDLDSSLRRKALAANLLLDRLPRHPRIPRLINDIRGEKRSSGHWGTTQANSLATMAIGKFLAQYPPSPASTGRLITMRGEQLIDGAHPVKNTLVTPERLTVKADGPGHLFVATATFGNRAGMDFQTVSQGLSVTRNYFDEAMNPVTQVMKGDLVKVKVTVNSPGRHDNVVVVDLLPGGLEIEDSTLATKWAPKDQIRHMRVDNIEKLDDRLLLFCALTGDTKHPAEFTYTARAVTVGNYAIPQVGVECMYAPDVRAASGAQGMLIITRPGHETAEEN